MGSVEPGQKMRALRYHGQKNIQLEEIDEPKCGPGQVAPKFCGICGTDLHEYLGGNNLIPRPDHPHPITKETSPLTLGHEFSGIIEEVGEGVTTHKIGDRVCVRPIIYDGSCIACQDGLINCCEKNGFVGLSGWGGGLSEHCVVPHTSAIPLPENVTLEMGALVEPLAVGWHAVDVSPLKPGETALVLGGGPIGLAVIQALRARDASKIIVSEIAPARKDFAKKFGADHVVDPSKEDAVARVKEFNNGKGADVAFDCAGVQPGLDVAMRAVRARGTVVNIAVWEKRATLEMNEVVFRERKYMGIATYSAADFPAVIGAMATGAIKPEKMITRKIKLDEVESKGFKALIEDKDNHVKILVDLDASLPGN
ncbi:MAG: hypothetical protein Q9227_005838 [Pyrenula ochraceoflavens]